jgi:hypothetical protein
MSDHSRKSILGYFLSSFSFAPRRLRLNARRAVRWVSYWVRKLNGSTGVRLVWSPRNRSHQFASYYNVCLGLSCKLLHLRLHKLE